ncbi:hypothetical protein [Heyndrickxia acidicola]|uniref:DUF2269 family protein n=1 Tax=Heyndrickxia acidicola TaxID=209389 RepID=A0ABU6MG09_9BACI|nr:hypothetical protein [Heyndrickxia acidicola]MED1203611.1 hypothetical protein [Heyndrickxia acidicola]
MHHILIFLHILSALLLGVFIIVPFIIKRLNTLSSLEQKELSGVLLGFVKVGEVALVGLLLTGGGMISEFGRIPSSLWMSITGVLLPIIGASLGMMHSKLKVLRAAKQAKNKTDGYHKRLQVYSWITMVSVLLAILVMTNPEIL